MKQSQKTEKSDYLQKKRVELRGYDEVHSTSCGEQIDENDVQNRFEKILAKGNLNQAYLQVVRNKGTAGVDGMILN